MAKLDRRSLLGGGAVCLAAGPAFRVKALGSEMSPRTLRLVVLFGRLSDLGDLFDRTPDTPEGREQQEVHFAEMETVCHEIHGISESVWASPMQDWNGILERALIAQFWHGEDHNWGNVKPRRELVAALAACKQSCSAFG